MCVFDYKKTKKKSDRKEDSETQSFYILLSACVSICKSFPILLSRAIFNTGSQERKSISEKPGRQMDIEQIHVTTIVWYWAICAWIMFSSSSGVYITLQFLVLESSYSFQALFLTVQHYHENCMKCAELKLKSLFLISRLV